jgi:NAD(P)-dependent dehydrogenase (short-subunit alcohol dehydrogenase family)
MAERPGPVLVTGANSGIGLESVLRLASRGWHVWGSVRSDEKAATLHDEAKRAEVSNHVHPLVLDVSDADAVSAVWPELPDFWAVVNNAGYAEVGAVEDVSAERARAQLDVNLIAPAVVSSCALPGMRRLGGGRIVMISSVAGRAAVMPLNAWYHASKFGLEALSDVLRVEVAGFGVAVSIVEPGFFRTHIIEVTPEQAGEGHADSLYRDAYARMETLSGLTSRFAPPPEYVARVVTSAIESRSPRRRYIVGFDANALLATQPFTPRALTDLAMRLFSPLPSSSPEEEPE